MRQVNINQKKAEVAILVSVKEDFRAKNITRDKRGSLHNENGINSLRGHMNPKCLCI